MLYKKQRCCEIFGKIPINFTLLSLFRSQWYVLIPKNFENAKSMYHTTIQNEINQAKQQKNDIH